MALINCPECGKEISDQAISCPNCGYVLNQKPIEVKPARDLVKIGSVVSLIGGIGFLVLTAITLIMASFTEQEQPDIYIELNTYIWFENIAVACIVGATVISIIILAKRQDLPGHIVKNLAVAMLVLSIAQLVALAISWNVAICCVGWIYIWANALLLIGSIICVVGTLRNANE